jgi:hypothetical protein
MNLTDDVERFRRRACECRRLAEAAHDDSWREQLNDIARELEEEADRLQIEVKLGPQN